MQNKGCTTTDVEETKIEENSEVKIAEIVEVKVCKGINELRRFIEEANRKSYEIIAMTEVMHTYTSRYTILYRT